MMFRSTRRGARSATRDARAEASSASPEAHIRDQELPIRLFGGKDASAALRAKIGEKPAAGRS
jgi:hypothetical protein